MKNVLALLLVIVLCSHCRMPIDESEVKYIGRHNSFSIIDEYFGETLCEFHYRILPHNVQLNFRRIEPKNAR